MCVRQVLTGLESGHDLHAAGGGSVLPASRGHHAYGRRGGVRADGAGPADEQKDPPVWRRRGGGVGRDLPPTCPEREEPPPLADLWSSNRARNNRRVRASTPTSNTIWRSTRRRGLFVSDSPDGRRDADLPAAIARPDAHSADAGLAPRGIFTCSSDSCRTVHHWARPSPMPSFRVAAGRDGIRLVAHRVLPSGVAKARSDVYRSSETSPVGAVGWSCENVGFSYPGASEPVLRGLSFDIAPGSAVVITGPSGAGKDYTFLNLLLAELTPLDGRIDLVVDEDTARRSPIASPNSCR